MNETFRGWYSRTTVVPTAGEIERRIAALQQYVAGLDVQKVLGTVLLAHNPGQWAAEAAQSLVQHVETADPSSTLRPTDLQVPVLANIALHFMLNEPGEIADIAAQAINCVSLRGAIPGQFLDDLVPAATKYLMTRSSELRQTAPPVDMPELNLARSIAIVQKLERQLPPEDSEEPIQVTATIIRGMCDAIVSLHRELKSFDGEISEYTESVFNSLEAQREETNILWWLLGGYSRDLNLPWQSLAVAEACLRAAKEVAELTRVVPGPARVRGLFEAVLRRSPSKRTSPVSLTEIVGSIDRDSRQLWASQYSDDSLERLAPVLLALSSSLRTPDGIDWSSIFSNVSNFVPTTVLDPIEWSCQFYDEILLSRLVQEISGAW